MCDSSNKTLQNKINLKNPPSMPLKIKLINLSQTFPSYQMILEEQCTFLLRVLGRGLFYIFQGPRAL